MKDYRQYKTEDFVTDRDFIRWVLEDRPEDDRFWHALLQEKEELITRVDEARSILLSLRTQEEFLSGEKLEQEMKTILALAGQKEIRRLSAGFSRWKYAAIFAGMVVIAAGGVWILGSTRHSRPAMEDLSGGGIPEKGGDIVEERNTGTEARTIALADGSTVHLSPQSVIRYSRQKLTGDTRDVYLSGEAFFEVDKNPNRPFRVFSHELIIKVLGTSFTVRDTKEDKEISVVVKTGKVSVYNKENENQQVGRKAQKLTGVVLMSNQQLVYNRQEQKFQKTLVDYPALINPSVIKNSFQYEDANVEDVLEELKKAFGIDILYDKEAFKHCRITADLSAESVYKKLDLICKALDTEYAIIDGQVVIQTHACP